MSPHEARVRDRRPGMTANPFSQRTLIIGAILVALSVPTLALWLFWDPSPDQVRPSPSSFSPAAPGSLALYELLAELDWPVSRGRARVADPGQGLLIAMLPSPSDDLDSRRVARITQAERSLIVLPKWNDVGQMSVGQGNEKNWSTRLTRVAADRIESQLESFEHNLSVLKKNQPVEYRPAAGLPVSITLPTITISEPQLLAKSLDVEPWIETDDGVLLGKALFSEGEQWILSDPDLLNNRGLDDSGHAVLAIDLLNELRSMDRPIILDEVLHGYERDPSLARILTEPPLLYVMIQIGVWIALAVWAGLARFSLPVEPHAGHRGGRELLLKNTAELLEYGRQGPTAVRPYLRYAIQEVARASGIDRQGTRRLSGDTISEKNIRTQLDAAGRSEQSVEELWQLTARVKSRDKTQALRLAADIRRWKEEMLHG